MRASLWRRTGKASRVGRAMLAVMVIVLGASCSSGSSSSTSSTSSQAASTSTGAVAGQIPAGRGAPRYVSSFPDTQLANCGAGSVPETGLQGQVPLAARQSGFKGFRCNMEPLSQYAGQGAEWVGDWYGHCFYMSTASGAKETNKGVAVVDVSDPSNARFVESLSTPGMLNTWEGVRTTTNGLLVGYQVANTPGLTGNWIDVYSIKDDCTKPVLQSSVQLGPANSGHEAEVSPDGKTFYVGTTQSPTPNLGLLAIDISKPNAPKLLTSWTIPIQDGLSFHIHGLGVSADGNLGYLVPADSAANENANGLIIVDLSQIQARKPNPQINVVSSLFWHDNSVGQMAEEFKLAGHPNRTYVIATDEGGAGSCANPQNPSQPPAAGGPCLYTPGYLWPSACDGHDPFAFGRIIDVTDPRVPTQIAQLKTQVQDPKNCSTIINDNKPGAIFGYNAHYCGVDNQQAATAIACGYFESGIRVFDIRDPYNPKEIAYYNPPPNTANVNTSSTLIPAPAGAYDPNPTADWASSWSEFYHAPDGTWNLVIQTQENGVQVVKFANGAYPLKGGPTTSTAPPD